MANAEIKTVLTADAKPLEGTLNKVQGQVSKMGAGGFIGMAKGIGVAGAAVAALGYGAKQIDDFITKEGSLAERLNVTAAGLGINTRELQAFIFTAKQAGNATDESLTAKLWKLQDSVEAVATGDKGMTEAFQRFGITANQVVSTPLPELLQRIAQGAQRSGTAVGDMNQIFGKGAAMELTGALQELATQGFDGLTKSAERAGQVIDDLALKRLERAKDRLEAVKSAVSNWFTETVTNFAFSRFGRASLGIFGLMLPRDEDVQDSSVLQARQRQERAAQLAKVQAERDKRREDKLASLREKQAEILATGDIKAADALARIGALSGGRSGMIETLAKQQLDMSKRQADYEKQILEVLKNG